MREGRDAIAFQRIEPVVRDSECEGPRLVHTHGQRNIAYSRSHVDHCVAKGSGPGSRGVFDLLYGNSRAAKMTQHWPGGRHVELRRGAIGRVHRGPCDPGIGQRGTHGGKPEFHIRCRRPALVTMIADANHIDRPQRSERIAHDQPSTGAKRNSSAAPGRSPATSVPRKRAPTLSPTARRSASVARNSGPPSRRTSAITKGVSISAP
jgi:hypothetical protein